MNCEHCPYNGSVTVPPRGNINAKLWIIGEAPGENEEKQRKPFVGGAGKVLYRLLRDAGIEESDCYFTNVLKCRPPNNDITTIDAQNAVLQCREQLYTELAVGTPTVIVPVGNTALHTLGIEQGITKVRGTPFITKYGKVLPTFHPAYLMRQQQEFVTAAYDWKKIRKHMESRNFNQFVEHYNLYPSLKDVIEFKLELDKRIRAKEKIDLAVDLETPFPGDTHEKTILVCGFATSENDAIVIPFLKADGIDYWASKGEELQVLEIVQDIIGNPHITKIIHNAMFDLTVLMSLGFSPKGPIYDSMIAHWLVFEPSHHSLAYCASIYTDLPPWKVETKWNDDLSLRKRNARDCCILFPVKQALDEDMKDNGVEWMFHTLMDNMLPTVRMELRGIPIDVKAKEEMGEQLSTSLRKEIAELQTMLQLPNFNPNSPTQVLKILKGRFKEHVTSTDKDALNDLILKHPEDLFLTKLLHHRTASKLYTTYIKDVRIWPDGRVRSHFKFGTVTCRYKSEDPNLLNLPTSRKDTEGYVRKMYRHLSKVVVEGDLSQTELRIFAEIIHDEKWLAAFAEGRDPHIENCIALVGEYRPEWRTFIKNFIYGLIYGSQGAEIEDVMPLSLRKMGVTVDTLLTNLHITHPGVRVYFKQVEEEVRGTSKVVNPFGLIRWFPGTITKANIREAVNFPIQSTNAVIMQKRMPELEAALGPDDELFLQLYDAFYILALPERIDRVATIMKDVMEQPITAPNGMTFQIPMKIEYGPTMFDGDMTTWRKKED